MVNIEVWFDHMQLFNLREIFVKIWNKSVKLFGWNLKNWNLKLTQKIEIVILPFSLHFQVDPLLLQKTIQLGQGRSGNQNYDHWVLLSTFDVKLEWDSRRYIVNCDVKMFGIWPGYYNRNYFITFHVKQSDSIWQGYYNMNNFIIFHVKQPNSIWQGYYKRN